jgi:hypothetical protein
MEFELSSACRQHPTGQHLGQAGQADQPVRRQRNLGQRHHRLYGNFFLILTGQFNTFNKFLMDNSIIDCRYL